MERVSSAGDERLGGTDGNEVLTSATAVALTLLLVAEGVTIIRMGGLRNAHMFIGMVLIPPVLLKLGSTGYRMVRYYEGVLSPRLGGHGARPAVGGRGGRSWGASRGPPRPLGRGSPSGDHRRAVPWRLTPV
jgi:hypothetical protein